METVSIDITRALAISGWMEEPELVWLAEQAIDHKCIVEIGSFLGRSTRALLDHTEGIVYAVDDWLGPRDVHMTKEERQALYKKFCENVHDHWWRHRAIIVVRDHASDGFPLPQAPDMVFLDGSHEYLDIKRDIEMWKAKLVKGGLLCGHDIDTPGVQQAVFEVLGDVDVVDNTSIWWSKL